MNFDLIKKEIDKNFDEEVKVLQKLISLKSEAMDVTEESAGSAAPFGKDVDETYRYVLGKGREFGFVPVDVDGYGGHLEFSNPDAEEQSEIFGIAVHLDCVPTGDGWSKEPFGGEIEEGKIFGRGAYDDKGPAVASLFAMKVLKDIGYIPKKRVRLILGLDEETNCYGMDYYLKNEEMPAMGFTPDGDFPVIYGEKGIMMFEIAKKFEKDSGEGIRLRSIVGGEADNMVAAKARAVINAGKDSLYDTVSKLADSYRQSGKMDVKTGRVGKSLEIKIKGVSAHGAAPWKGKNAISQLMEFLGNIEFSSEGVNDFIEFYNEHIAYETNGESLGCLLRDKVSGDTILNVGKIDMNTKSVHLTVNIRYPISFNEDDIYTGMEDALQKYNLGVVKNTNKSPLFVSPDSDFIKGLASVYQEVTGDMANQPMVIGGGTYARHFEKDFVAFGAKFPEGESVEHQADEYISVEDLKLMTEIFARAIVKFA